MSLVIENKGILSENDLFFLGMTTKDQNPKLFGNWGTGLKYAIAFLLRNKIEFSIYSNGREYKFDTFPMDHHGEIFNVIKVNGKTTSMTTKFGKDYKWWQTLREIVSNALDSGETTISFNKEYEYIRNRVLRNKERTLITIKSSEPSLNEVIKNWNHYFIFNLPQFQSPLFTLYYVKHPIQVIEKDSKETTCIYKDGILVYDTGKIGIYHYNMDWVSINELRDVENTWNVTYDITVAIASSEDINFINSFVRRLANPNLLETQFDYSWGTLSKQWIDFFTLNNFFDHKTYENLSANGFKIDDKDFILPKSLITKAVNQFSDLTKFSKSYGHSFSYWGNKGETFILPAIDDKVFRRLRSIRIKLTNLGIPFKKEIQIATLSTVEDVYTIKGNIIYFNLSYLNIKSPTDNELLTVLLRVALSDIKKDTLLNTTNFLAAVVEIVFPLIRRKSGNKTRAKAGKRLPETGQI